MIMMRGKEKSMGDIKQFFKLDEQRLQSEIYNFWKLLICSGKIVHFQKENTVIYENHMPLGIYILTRGSIELLKENEPEFCKIILPDKHPIIGMDFLLADLPYPYSAIAKSDVLLCFLSKAESLNIFDKKTLPILHSIY